MSAPKKPADIPTTLPLPWKTFGKYIEARLEEKRISKRKMALDLEIDPAHMTRLTQDKVRPLPETCIKVAQYFGDMALPVLMLTGWIKDEDIAREWDIASLMADFASVMYDHKALRSLLEEFKTLPPDERAQLVKMFLVISREVREIRATW